jgi:ABC-type cobalamin/Fe3+-siderophores transport system ATPase subunit
MPSSHLGRRKEWDQLTPDEKKVFIRQVDVFAAYWAYSNHGGERARVMIARLMLAAADMLLLDEPTNDLDIPTLEVLEGSLLEFSGAVVLVSMIAICWIVCPRWSSVWMS